MPQKQIHKYKMVLARRNPEGPYDKGNCYWRPPRTQKEARMGLEELWADEPESIPMTQEERTKRNRLPLRERPLFDIWRRMTWRIRNSLN